MEVEFPELNAQRAKNAQHKDLIDTIEKQVSAKLYHQMTGSVLEYLQKGPQGVLDFFKNFIVKFSTKLSPLRFANILKVVAKEFSDPKEAASFLDEQEEVLKNDRDAHLMWQIVKIDVLLLCANLSDALTMLDKCWGEIEGSYGTDTVVLSAFHQVAANYYKLKSNHEVFLKHSLLYLAYTPLADIPESGRATLAFEIGVASIIAAKEFDFGELLQQPLMEQCLSGSKHAWVWDLLQAFHEGKIDIYNKVMEANAANIAASQDLARVKDTVMKEKIILVALMDLAFSKPTLNKQRCLGFAEVAEHCRIPEKTVEMVLMRAMSLGLVRGIIDQVDRCVALSWVKPRILDKPRIEIMQRRLEAWATNATSLLANIEDLTPELLVS